MLSEISTCGRKGMKLPGSLGNPVSFSFPLTMPSCLWPMDFKLNGADDKLEFFN